MSWLIEVRISATCLFHLQTFRDKAYNLTEYSEVQSWPKPQLKYEHLWTITLSSSDKASKIKLKVIAMATLLFLKIGVCLIPILWYLKTLSQQIPLSVSKGLSLLPFKGGRVARLFENKIKPTRPSTVVYKVKQTAITAAECHQ